MWTVAAAEMVVGGDGDRSRRKKMLCKERFLFHTTPRKNDFWPLLRLSRTHADRTALGFFRKLYLDTNLTLWQKSSDALGWPVGEKKKAEIADAARQRLQGSASCASLARVPHSAAQARLPRREKGFTERCRHRSMRSKRDGTLSALDKKAGSRVRQSFCSPVPS